MLVVKIRLPDSQDLMQLSLPRGRALLVGRDPHAERLNGPPLEAVHGMNIQSLPVSSGRVSSNHVLLVERNDEVQIWDLASKNGTWLRLQASQPVILPISGDVTIELANPTRAPRICTGPKEAEWATEEAFAAAVVQAINDWLQQAGCNARARVQSGSTSNDHGDVLPLADGSTLRLLPLPGLTLEIPWGQVQERIVAYIGEQNLRYEQLIGHDEDFVLASATMRQAHRDLADAAAYGVRVMILGPTGAGKERLARCYHRHSRQHRGPYVSVNCALLKEGLLYAQLFGAKRGSFTGATGDLVGFVESAHDGTLFLDEVGDMDSEVQKALLRFLDTRGEYQRLGDTQIRHAKVQIVCATNLPLDDAEFRRGRYRDDLWYRLGVKVVRIPPLSERAEDILAFLRLRTLRAGQIRVHDALSREALRHLMADPLPGNFRDLENFVDRLPPMASVGTIDAATCAAALQEGRKPKVTRWSSGNIRVANVGASRADWETICALAIEAFRQDQGDTPRNWSQLYAFIEKYVKPLFVAHSCDLAGTSELSKTTNYSELARRLLIADGSTVKAHLLRYLERFSQKAPS